MQVMVLDDDPEHQARLARALMARGFQVVCVDSLAMAEAVVRLDMLDLLILGERVRGRLSHPVALLAECRNPAVPSIFITDRQGEEIAELFELIPSVYSIMGRSTAPNMVAQIAVAAVVAMPARTRQDAPAIIDEVAPIIVPVMVGPGRSGQAGTGQAGMGQAGTEHGRMGQAGMPAASVPAAPRAAHQSLPAATPHDMPQTVARDIRPPAAPPVATPAGADAGPATNSATGPATGAATGPIAGPPTMPAKAPAGHAGAGSVPGALRLGVLAGSIDAGAMAQRPPLTASRQHVPPPAARRLHLT